MIYPFFLIFWSVHIWAKQLSLVFRQFPSFFFESAYRIRSIPSPIAVYGDDVPKIKTPQDYARAPTTVYGISKIAGENWAQYYFQKYELDVRSIRYLGVIGYQSLPGGGTTDYAVDIYHKAIHNQNFECFFSANIALPIIYMDDAIRATTEIMDAPVENITIRTSYNLSGMSFSPTQIADEIRKSININVHI